MENFINVASWTQPHSDSTPARSRPFGHFRSLSSMTAKSPSPSPRPRPQKSPSTSQLPIIQPGELTTLPDPRSRGTSPVRSPLGATTTTCSGDGSPTDPNDEVATLSAKLINAINHQTNLDDSLAMTRRDLDASNERVGELEAQVRQQREMLAGDVWVRRTTVEAEQKALRDRAAEEKKRRLEVEADKRKIEVELENLSTALFEEANKMVVTAKEEAKAAQDAMQRKNDHLRAQIADGESLLRSQQEQLAELKLVMEQMMAERDDQTNLTTPSSPGFSRLDSRDEDGEQQQQQRGPQSPVLDAVSPTNPTSFTQLLQPVLRTDLAAYEDFLTLARHSRARAGNRTSTGSAVGSALGISLGGVGSSGSTPTLPASYPHSPPSQSPSTPNSPTGPTGPPLKDSKFYKRVLVEDIEPTLRLDTAPSLSWLNRRSVLASILEGALVVEPIPTTTTTTTSPTAANTAQQPELQPCSLCGETRRDDRYLRRHRFRTSESESAHRHPLCGYCLWRLRSTCDFVGFLRILRDGLWRTDDADGEAAAWEESVRLREQMFWARIGGGVVPAGQVEVEKNRRASRESERAKGEARDEAKDEARAAEEEVPEAKEDAAAGATGGEGGDEADEVTIKDGAATVARDVATPPGSNRNSTQSLEVAKEGTEADPKRLSLSIPSEA